MCFEEMLKTSNACIIGNGAIGSLLAARCEKLNFPYDMWWRKFSDEALTVNFIDGSSALLRASKPAPTQLLIIPSKAWQVAGILKQYRSHISANTCIALMHNGIGTEDRVLNAFPDNPVLRITTSKAALKVSATTINETGKGTSHAGWLRQPTPKQENEIHLWCDQVLEDCQWFDDIRLPLWQKLAINCVINPLTAVHNIKNGELLKPKYRSDIEQLLEEFFLVAEAEKLPLVKVKITQQVWAVIEKTADNYSSMHQDIIHNRKTEIDYINGFLVAQAKSRGQVLPLNQSLIARIKKQPLL